MSFGKSRRWYDWMPRHAHLAPGQRQDLKDDPRLSFVAAAKRRGATINANQRGRAGFGSSTQRKLEPGKRKKGQRGRKGHSTTDEGAPVFTQFRPPRPKNAWGARAKAGTFGSSRRDVSVRWL